MHSPLFSSYRQGENRVSASLLAVFERLGVDLVARVLGEALEQPELVLVSYAAQPGGGGAGVPDAEMPASFCFLFEVKTVPDQIAGHHAQKQLGRHLDRLDGSHRTELLVVLTPDAGPPPLVESMGDPRVVWTSFEALTEAIRGLLNDPQEPASEQQRVPAGGTARAVRTGPPGRDRGRRGGRRGARLRRVVAVWGVHLPGQPHLPGGAPLGLLPQQAHRARVPSAPAGTRRGDVRRGDGRTAGRRRPVAARLAKLIRELLADGETPDGDQRGVYLLQRADDPDLPRREHPLPHPELGAWTQGQRYASWTASVG